ncbi:Sialin-like protein [Leptotrombidium deliense]|uniref:Sialin-like protein n=1 Tax=Leptotrombidium deliense TaxID=299467 RepID=A0A443SIU3_9ACAR|nr:Sialin-like protein [Leptotrombidium deliense]
MVNNTALMVASEQSVSEHFDGGCPREANTSHHNYLRKEGIYVWTPSMQAMILGSYFYGYTATQVSGGRLAEKWGGKWVCGIGILGSAIATFLVPMSADYFIVIIGAFHGLVYSSVYNIFMKWVPQNERSTAIAFMMAAGHFGGFVVSPFTGFLCDNSFMGGWPAAFYILAIIACVWSALWFIFVTDLPENHPRISKAELMLIKSGTNQQTKPEPLKWSKILKSTAVWAVVFAKTTAAFGYYLISNELPLYLESVLNVNITENGFSNALVYLVVSISMFSTGKLAGYINSKQILSLTNVRKIFQALAAIGPMVCLLLVPLSGCNKQSIVALIVASMFFFGFCGGGELLIVTEFAPAYSGTIFGFANCFGSITGILAPLFVGILLDENVHDRHNWNLVFYVSAALYAVGALVFVVFATAKPTKWGSNKCATDKCEVKTDKHRVIDLQSLDRKVETLK